MQSNRWNIALQTSALTLILTVPLAFITNRYGISAWKKIWFVGWPFITTALLTGFLLGLVGWKWLEKSWPGRLLMGLSHTSVAIVSGYMLLQELETSDVWFGVLLVTIQVGVHGIVDTLLRCMNWGYTSKTKSNTDRQ